MSEPLIKRAVYTYSDYCAWDDGVRWELLDGVAYAMSPAPFQPHQEVVIGLGTQFHNFLKDKSCKVFVAPFDVRLAADEGDDTVVQPDLLVVCDKSKLDGKCCNGAPDLVVEVLSPGSVKRDRVDKKKLYQRFGVKEYWIADPDNKSVEVYTLKDGKYWIEAHEKSVTSGILPGCTINLEEVFAELD